MSTLWRSSDCGKFCFYLANRPSATLVRNVSVDECHPPEEKVVNAVHWVLDRHLDAGHGARVAVIDHDQSRTFTYGDLMDRVAEFAGALIASGVRRGDVVVISIPLSIEAVTVLLAVAKLGAVAAPVSVLLSKRELTPILHSTSPSAAVYDAASAQALREALDGLPKPLVARIVLNGEASAAELDFDSLCQRSSPAFETADVDAEDPLVILYTSGSTSAPKAVVRPHRMLPVAAKVNAFTLMGLTRDSVCFQPHQDISFSYPLGHGVLFPLYSGASFVISTGRVGQRFFARRVFETIATNQVTVFSAATSVYKRLLAEPSEFDTAVNASLDRALVSTEPFPANLYIAWNERFSAPLFQTFGQTEVPSFLGFFAGVPNRTGSLGRPFPGADVAIVDDHGQRVPDGEVGRLALRADYGGLCSGYLNLPERWREVCHDGWYFTQDLAYRDPAGYFWHVGREDDVVKVDGYSVAPAEVESVLLGCPGVADAAVIVEKDAAARLVVCAVIVPEVAEADQALLKRQVDCLARERLARYKVPRRYEIRSDLPRSHNGKILRRALLDMAAGPVGDPE